MFNMLPIPNIISRPILLALIIGGPVFLAGCAASGKDYPSLAIRDVERMPHTGSAPSNYTGPAALSPNIAARLPQLEASARAAHRSFNQALPAARSAVNSGGRSPIASEAWAQAQTALGELDSRRSKTAIVLSDLDILYVNAALADEQREEIARVRDIVTALVNEEDRALAQLRARVAG